MNLTTAIASLDLTPRQSEVIALVVQGYTYAEAAAELKITDRTAKHHARMARDRLGCKTFRCVTRRVWQRMALSERDTVSLGRSGEPAFVAGD